MAVTVADIQAMPGLSGASDADVTFWLDESDQWVGSIYGAADTATRDRAIRYWVAHALTVQTSVGMAGVGPVRDRRVGDVQVTHAVADVAIGSVDWLALSNWGQLFLGMARTYAPPHYPIA